MVGSVFRRNKSVSMALSAMGVGLLALLLLAKGSSLIASLVLFAIAIGLLVYALIVAPEDARSTVLLLTLLSLAFFVRSIPAVYGPLADVGMDELMVRPFLSGDNIYVVTHNLYPYTTLWLYIVTPLFKLSEWAHLSPGFVVKSFLALVDAGITALLFWGTLRRTGGRTRAFLVGLAYALNPVSVMITGFHGNRVSLAVLFVLAAYCVLAFVQEGGHLQLSALLLGLGIALRGDPILLLPIFAWKAGASCRRKIEYALLAVLPTALLLVPFLVATPTAVRREIFGYSGVTDFGYASVLRSWTYYQMYSGRDLPNAAWVKSHLADIDWMRTVFASSFMRFLTRNSKAVFLICWAVSALWAVIKRVNLLDSVLVVYLMFYFLYHGISAQYLLWVLPFALMLRNPMVWPYTILASMAMVGFYLSYWPEFLLVRRPLHSLETMSIYTFSNLLLWVYNGMWLGLRLVRPQSKGQL